ncbi:MAG: beta-propeller fold lactonase family protein [Burkholderiales bacterium]
MTTVVYVSNADSGDVSVLRLDERSGALGPLQTVEVGGMVMPMAVSPDRRFLYAARRSDPMAVVSFGIDQTDGRLTPLSEAPLPASMAYIATDRSGRFLFSASYPGSLIAVSAIGADGTVQPAHQVMPTAPHAHAIRADASNGFVFATSLGGGHLMQLRFDSASGMLTSNDPRQVDVRPGAGPRHLEFHTNGRFVYLLNELDASLDVFLLDSANGTLTHEQTIDTLPPGFGGEPWAADLHLSPDGRFLYSSERRSSTLAAFRVDASSGQLALIGHYATQAQPRGFAIDPSGRFALVAGEQSNCVSAHAIDPASGALTALHETAVGRGPNWIEIIELP